MDKYYSRINNALLLLSFVGSSAIAIAGVYLYGRVIDILFVILSCLALVFYLAISEARGRVVVSWSLLLIARGGLICLAEFLQIIIV